MPSPATAALLQNTMGTPATRSVTGSIAPVRVSTRSRPFFASQTRSRPSRSISSPSGRPPVWATRSIRRPSWDDPPERAVLGAGEDGALVGPSGRHHDVLRAGAGDREHVDAHEVILW